MINLTKDEKALIVATVAYGKKTGRSVSYSEWVRIGDKVKKEAEQSDKLEKDIWLSLATSNGLVLSADTKEKADQTARFLSLVKASVSRARKMTRTEGEKKADAKKAKAEKAKKAKAEQKSLEAEFKEAFGVDTVLDLLKRYGDKLTIFELDSIATECKRMGENRTKSAPKRKTAKRKASVPATA